MYFIISLVFFLLAICTGLLAQQTTAVVNLKMVAQGVQSLTQCYIKIESVQQKKLLAYFNAGLKDSASIHIESTAYDTLLITVSHIGYSNAIIKKAIRAISPEYMQVNLELPTPTLENVTVTAPIWVRGDTTFFSAEAFKEGDERKLKDIITKMPGFEINESGQLLYKKQAVEKVMIEGEEIFADKLRLMLNSFPVHVLNTVQALENQHANKLLKGLTSESRVYLNIGLTKKAKLNTAFGDGEAGIGTGWRYLFNPVLFSMVGTLKAGYIGKWNSIGENIDWRLEEEMKNDPIRQGEQWMMQAKNLRIINNFEGRRYIKNRQIDNRLQLSFAASKKMKNSIEVGYVTDRQQQNTFLQSTFFGQVGTVARNDTNHILYSPKFFLARYQLEWDVDSASSVKQQLYFYSNKSSGLHRAIYNQLISGVHITDTTQNNIKNRWHGFQWRTDFTRRLSKTKALLMFADFAYHLYPQQGLGYSNSWPRIFQLSNPAYSLLEQQLTNHYLQGKVGAQWLIKTGSGIFINELTMHYNHAKITSLLSFNEPNKSFPSFTSNLFSGNGNYSSIILQANTQKQIKLLGLPFFLNAKYGLAQTTIHDKLFSKNFIIPIIMLEMNGRHKLAKRLNGTAKFSVGQQPILLHELPYMNMPNAIASFNANRYNKPVSKPLTGSYGLGYAWKKNMNSTSILFMYSGGFNNWMRGTGFNGFFMNAVDTLLNRFIGNTILNTSSTINIKQWNMVFNFGGGYHFNNRLVNFEDKIIDNLIHSWNIYTRLRKNFAKKYYLTLDMSYGQSAYKQGANNNFKGLANKTARLKAKLLQRWLITKNMDVAVNLETYYNNLFSPNYAAFVFADAAYNISIPGKPFSFSLRAENLTNQRYFFDMDNTPLFQRFNQIPLVQRNLFVSVRYEL